MQLSAGGVDEVGSAEVGLADAGGALVAGGLVVVGGVVVVGGFGLVGWLVGPTEAGGLVVGWWDAGGVVGAGLVAEGVGGAVVEGFADEDELRVGDAEGGVPWPLPDVINLTLFAVRISLIG